MNPRAAQVTCPTCKKTGDWLATPWGPFCSKRCKLIDLGKWLGGEHVISEPLRAEHLEKYSGPPTNGHSDPSKAGDN
ncbi:MAG TPA: DNA gyrase inhibitor YacG [Verrucomicrobiae bacterium]|nr:DNA gyrase inhibitor YacG [Verrucomicrobiae bacterium]